jgi:hypothetical protein
MIYCWGALFDGFNSQLFFKICSIYIIMKSRRPSICILLRAPDFSGPSLSIVCGLDYDYVLYICVIETYVDVNEQWCVVRTHLL